MMTSSNGNIFRVTGPLCGEFTGPGEFPTQRPVTWSFDVFFDVRLNKRLSKHSSGWLFETLSWSLWRHHNVDIFCRQHQGPHLLGNIYLDDIHASTQWWLRCFLLIKEAPDVKVNCKISAHWSTIYPVYFHLYINGTPSKCVFGLL